MYVSMKSMLDYANQEGFAIPAINCINMEMARGAISAAEEEQAAIIINIGCGQMRNHAHSTEMVPLVKGLAQQANVPVALNLDHGARLQDITRYINAGFSSIMIDASDRPYEENVAATHTVCQLAHPLGISVEGELGHVGQTSAADDEKTDLYTDPALAADFVCRTQVDALAVAIGTAHGNYPRQKIPRLDFQRLDRLKKELHMPLVLHGGSGSGEENLKRAVKLGINKVNICTDAFQICKAAFLSASRDNSEMDYMNLCMVVEKEMKEFAKRYLHLLGGSGRYSFRCFAQEKSLE